MEELHFNADISGERIDKFLDGRIESLSRSYIQKLIKEKKILVNQLPVKANYKLTTGDTIILQIPDPEPVVFMSIRWTIPGRITPLIPDRFSPQ